MNTDPETNITIIKRHFQDEVFAFRKDGWICATIAAKRFDKLAYDWLKLKSTQEYIAALENEYKSTTSDLKSYVTKKYTYSSDKPVAHGGGIWIHPDLAILFARWLSADFAVWCDKQIKEIINGSSAKPSIPSHIESLRGWADALEENERKAQVIEAQQEQLEVQQPAVDLVERYLNAPETEGVQVIAKILGYSQKELVAFCEENDILYRKAKGGNLLPHQKWIDAGYFKVKTGERYGHAYTQTRFTTRGFKWISEQIPNRIPVAKSLFLDPNASNLHLH